MDMKLLEEEAKNAALKRVTNLFQKPGQLEKLEQYKRRIERKSVSVEAMLKTAMQSQLDGVVVGMEELKSALTEISDNVDKRLDEIHQVFSELPDLGKKLKEVAAKNTRHSQYVTAIENLKHLFTVPESVEKTKQWIADGKLLMAHQLLIDLEMSRDNLLYELHKSSNQSVSDRMLLKAYFEDVEHLSTLLEKQLKLVAGRILNIVRKEPTVVVTAIRIIEREEKADALAAQRQKQKNFNPPGRPKAWRAMAMKEMEKSVAQRIEGTQIDDRANNKMWLVTYLELLRQFVLEDLRVVKTLCGPCFPPSYNIVDKFVDMYHEALSTNLEQIVANGLEGNEYVTVLCWVKNTYPGLELMRHPDLNVCTGPLLKANAVLKLQQSYFEAMESNYKDWMMKALDTEKKEWELEARPEESADGYYHTASPIIIFQMIDQNLQVAATIGPELTQKALILSLDQVKSFGKLYRDAVAELKERHFENRNKIPYFTQHVITVLNNCTKFCSLAEQMKNAYWKSEAHNPATSNYESLLQCFQSMREEAARFLLDEAFLDLEAHFNDILSPKWMTSSLAVDTICVTLEDYLQDYAHLEEDNFKLVLRKAEDAAAAKYIGTMLQRRTIVGGVSFKSSEERKKVAAKISREVEQLKAFFAKIATKAPSPSRESPLEAILALAEVVKSEDLEILSLDLYALVDKYPDIGEDHLLRLLALRGDVSRSEAKEKVEFVKKANGNRPRVSMRNSIFHYIP